MKGTVLIIDDEKNVCESVAKVLRKEGYQPLMAADGIEAFELYKRRLPDLVLLDLNMPRQNGWATFEKISEFNPLTPIIIITGRPDQPGLAAVARVGALIEKPFDVSLLIEVVQQLIEEPIPKRIHRLSHGYPRAIYPGSADERQ
jgi:DNA-binding response OmpR family regulator